MPRGSNLTPKQKRDYAEFKNKERERIAKAKEKSKAILKGRKKRRKTMWVRVINRFNPTYGKSGLADEKAWSEEKLWIPVMFGTIRYLVARHDLEAR